MKRAFLTGLGITDGDVIKQIIDYHQGVVTDMKEDITAVKADLKTAQKDLKDEQAKQPEQTQVIKVEDTEEYKALKAKYDTDLAAEQKKYTDKVTADDAEKTTSTVTAATLKALKEKGFSAKALEEPMFAEMMAAKIKELVPNAKIKDGNITNLDDLTKPFIEGMKGFIGETTVEGTKVVTHGATTGTTDADPFIAGFDGKK